VVEHIGGGVPQGTVMDRPGGTAAGAAATVVEARYTPGPGSQGGMTAAPTMVERQMTYPGQPAKSKAPLFIAIAAVLIVAVIAAVVFLRPKPEPGPTPGPTPAGEGYLLVASPFGETVSVENTADNSKVTLSDNVAPLRAALPPGKYRVTLDAGGGKTQTHDVTLEAGKEAAPIYSRVEVNVDQAVEAVLNP
jgi:hypothetical protein